MKTRIWCAGVVAMLVATSCMLASSAGARTLAAPEASVTGITPTHVVAGQRVTIYGSGLAGKTSVMFGSVPSRSVIADPAGTWIRAVVPTGAPVGKVPVTVSVGGARMSNLVLEIGAGSVPAAANRPPSTTSPNSHVKVVVAPRIIGFSPSMGHVGARVRIMGANLNGTQWLKFGGIRTQIVRSSASSIIAVVPKRAHTGKINVHTRGGTGVSTGAFRVLGSTGV